MESEIRCTDRVFYLIIWTLIMILELIDIDHDGYFMYILGKLDSLSCKC